MSKGATEMSEIEDGMGFSGLIPTREEKYIERLEKENQTFRKQLTQVTKERNELLELVAEANDLFNLIYEGEYKVDSFTAQPYRQLLEKIKETK